MGKGDGRLTLTLSLVLVALIVIGGGAAVAVGRAHHVAGEPTGTAPNPSAPPGRQGGPSGGAPAPGPASGEPAGASNTVIPATTHRSTGTKPPTPPTTTDPNAPVQVTLSASAEGSPEANAIADLISRYFTAINRHDYDAWLTTVSTAQAKRDRDSWTKVYSSTYDLDVYISDITTGDPMTVRMQFTSHQSLALAPAELRATCVRWDVTYKIVDEGVGLRVGTSAKKPAMAQC